MVSFPTSTTASITYSSNFDDKLTCHLTATDTTPVVPEIKKESGAAPAPNTVAAAAPLPEVKDTTPASPTAPPTAPAEPSKTAETDPIHSVQPVQKSEEPIMAEPVTEAAKPAHDQAKPAAAEPEVHKESILAEPTKETEPAKAADIAPAATSQGMNIPRDLTTKEEQEAEALKKKNEKAKNASLVIRGMNMLANVVV